MTPSECRQTATTAGDGQMDGNSVKPPMGSHHNTPRHPDTQDLHDGIRRQVHTRVSATAALCRNVEIVYGTTPWEEGWPRVENALVALMLPILREILERKKQEELSRQPAREATVKGVGHGDTRDG